MITLVVIDTQQQRIEALIGHLDYVSDISLLCYGHDGIKAIEMVDEYQPSVVLMELEMPGLNGIEATKIITHRFPHTKIILLIDQENRQILRLALEAGARGIIFKNTDLEDVEQIMRLIDRGFYQLSPISSGFEPTTSIIKSSNNKNNDVKVILDSIKELEQSIASNHEMMTEIVRQRNNRKKYKYSRSRDIVSNGYNYHQKYLIDLAHLGNDSFFITGFVFGVLCCAIAFYFLTSFSA